MKCWKDGCKKPLKMDLVLTGYCPDHGEVWSDDKPITPELKRLVAELLVKQPPERVIAILLSKLARVDSKVRREAIR